MTFGSLFSLVCINALTLWDHLSLKRSARATSCPLSTETNETKQLMLMDAHAVKWSITRIKMSQRFFEIQTKRYK